MPRTRATPALVAVLAPLIFCALALAQPETPALASSVPALDHIIVIVMENKSYDQVRTAPFTATMIAAGSSFSNSYGITHPSQPNYLAMWGGSTMGVTSNFCPAPGSPYFTENLGHACEAAGVTWRAYSENLPIAGAADCTWDLSLYTRKHDPWTNWGNLDHNNERPFTDLQTDIDNGTLPRLAFVIPNNCNNSHNTGCTVATGDNWLAIHVPTMLQAVGAHGIVVLTWDEDDGTTGSPNHILTVFDGPPVQTNYVSTGLITHYTLLRTLCDALGLQPFAAAASESSITDVWQDALTAVQAWVEKAEAQPGRVRLSWRVTDPGLFSARIERRTPQSGWATIAEASPGAEGRITHIDTEVLPGAHYGYRLAVPNGREELHLGEVWVDVPRAPELALAAVRPNPTGLDLTVELTLLDSAPARLELLDVRGRSVLGRDLAAVGPGRHVVSLRPSEALPAGVYFVRLTQSARSVYGKAVVVR